MCLDRILDLETFLIEKKGVWNKFNDLFYHLKKLYREKWSNPEYDKVHDSNKGEINEIKNDRM